MIPAQIFNYAGVFCAGALAVATALRAGRSVPRWAFVAGLVVLAVESLFVALSNGASTAGPIGRWQMWRLLTASLIPGTWLLFSSTYARGPDRAWSGWKRYGILVTLIVLPALAWWLREQLIVEVRQTVWDTQWLLLLSWQGNILWAILLVTSVWVVVNLERTFQASVGTARWRIKYMLLGVGLVFVARIYTSSQVLLFRGVDSEVESVNSIALMVGSLLTVRSLFRTGSFELEVYPSHAVLQKSLTVLLAGAYLLIVGVLAKVVTYIGGDAAFAAKAFLVLAALVLLAIMLQSDRARLELRRFVSRNFRRSPYDYRVVWKTFTDGTASRVEQSDLCRGLVKLTADTFQALSVSIWLVDDKKEALVPAASTFLPATDDGTKVNPPRPGATQIVERFQAKSEPVVLESHAEEWALQLRQYHPVQFENGGNRVCVPLIGRGEVLGLIVVGDRVGGEPFSLEDLDMLKCVGDHAAASLLNVQLSKKLLQAKELEAFQAMAAFFVHDLKNAASTLNLLLQNLPVHFDDPEFRQDALRGIAKIVTHINQLIGRLGLLRHELKIEAVDADLNEVIEGVLAGIERAPGYTLTKDTRDLPKAAFDPDQIQKVVTNLVLNSTEALAEGGRVHVSTSHENGWVILTVEDNGCGMSPEFLAHSLFRPFQTTKKNGLGIGMFQSRMIVEAHGGRISVTSVPGQGTTFRVFLRAASTHRS